ncbi:hypothetical protein FHS29_004807 [Saccharothrix tamanrassetensis]|uniref:RDD domain-containing protein n=1 Tax=Saccharothrix tamanrassetensis TaxID=1051531 RepID=A0A841CLM0_9PSEU|nr:RDD family protein [Saccharothrix tamanrassetensis]MBB5958199.1 hypothetical protein [Saccharothrix tamanrassetensis]
MLPQTLPPRHLGRRWVARLLDWLLVLVLTSPLWALALGHVKHSAALSAASVADDSVLGVFSARWDDAGDSAAAGLSEVWGDVTLSVVAVMVAQVLAVALYDFVAHAWFGRTVGKVVTSLSVVSVDGTRRVRPARALARSVLTVLLPGAGWVALLVGALRLDVVWVLVGVVLLAVSFIECLALRGPSCWHDRRTRTVVQPVDWAAKVNAVRNSNAWSLAQGTTSRVLDRGRSLRDRFGTGGPPR